MLRLYSADVCPFAQRTRALLFHLGVEFTIETIDLNDRDADFLKLTPTGRVPLLVDGKTKLYESGVINEYLADRYEYAAAFDPDVYVRARERLAMSAWDATVVPAFYRHRCDAIPADVRKAVSAELAELRSTVGLTGARQGGLLSFHCAPFWARFDWLREFSHLPGLIDEWIDLKTWLDAAVAQPAIQSTLPEREATIARYRAKFAQS